MEELSSIKFDKLTEENYVTWSHRMRWVLELKGLWQAVEEESTGTSRDRQAKALIGLAVQDSLVPYVTGAATPVMSCETGCYVFGCRGSSSAVYA